jgi:predicted O-linked N-acetylglucosamine transferase (SPINDLY family)
MTKNLSASLAGLALLFAAGCGGGDGGSNKTLSYSDFSKKANAICQKAEDDNKALGQSTTQEATPENGQLIGKLVNIVEKQRDDLEALKAPDRLEAAQDEFVSITNQQVDIAKEAQTAANEQDQKGYENAVKRLQALSGSANAAGSKLGAEACSR